LFGLASFFSPCVLPLVPVYIGYLSGTTVASANQAGQVNRWLTFSHAVVLVLGFSLVFIALGAVGGALGMALNRAIPSITRVGGVMLAVFGLRIMAVTWSRGRWLALAALVAAAAFVMSGREPLPNRVMQSALFGIVVIAAMPWPLAGHVVLGGLAAALNFVSVWSGSAGLLGSADWGGFTPTLTAIGESGLIWFLVAWASRTDVFYMERRIELDADRSPGYVTSLLTGMVFAAGWTPCVGPILAGILALAATGQSALRGAVLLTFYSIGLGIPFLLAGLAFSQVSQLLPKLRRYMGLISLVSGFLMVLVGVLIYTGTMQSLATYVPQVSLETWLAELLGHSQ